MADKNVKTGPKVIKTTTIEQGRKVKPRDYVTVTWKKGKFHKDGDTSQVHVEQQTKLAAAGKIYGKDEKPVEGGEVTDPNAGKGGSLEL